MSNAVKVYRKNTAQAIQLTKENLCEAAEFARTVEGITTRVGGGWLKLATYNGSWERVARVGDWVVVDNNILFHFEDEDFKKVFKKPAKAGK